MFSRAYLKNPGQVRARTCTHTHMNKHSHSHTPSSPPRTHRRQTGSFPASVDMIPAGLRSRGIGLYFCGFASAASRRTETSQAPCNRGDRCVGPRPGWKPSASSSETNDNSELIGLSNMEVGKILQGMTFLNHQPSGGLLDFGHSALSRGRTPGPGHQRRSAKQPPKPARRVPTQRRRAEFKSRRSWRFKKKKKQKEGRSLLGAVFT